MFMNIEDLSHGLEFNNNALDNEVQPVPAHHDSLKFDGDGYLGGEGNLPIGKRDTHRLLVDAFTEARPKGAVNGQGGADQLC